MKRFIYSLVAVLVVCGNFATAGTFNRPKGDVRFRELSQARQPLPSAELDNEFNTVKNWLNGSATFTQNISEWALYQPAVAYKTTSTFTIIGDVTDIFTAGRAIKANLNGTYAYSLIASSAYDSGTTKTTVTLDDAVLTSSLTQIYYGILSPDSKSLPKVAVMSVDDIKAKAPHVDSRVFTNASTAKVYAQTNGYLLDINAPVGVTSLNLDGVEIGRVKSGAFAGTTVSGLKEARPEWWGAKGDDSTDDTAELKKAVESGAKQIILTKTYKIDLQAAGFTTTDAINVPSDITISGGGIGTIHSFNVVTSDQSQPPVFYIADKKNITFDGIRFVNDSDLDRRLVGSNKKGAGNFVLITSSAAGLTENITVRNCYAERNLETAFSANSDYEMRNLRFINNNFVESGGHCMGFKHVTGGVISGNTSYNHKGVQFTGLLVGLLADISYGCIGCVVTGNTENGVVNGIKTESDSVLGVAKSNIIANNVLKNFAEGARTGAFAIQLNGENDTCTGNIVDIGTDLTTGLITTETITGIKTAGYSKNAVINENDVTVNGVALHLYVGDTFADDERTAIVAHNFLQSIAAQGIWIYNYKNVRLDHNNVQSQSYALQSRGLHVDVVGGKYSSGGTAAAVILIQPTTNNSVTTPYFTIRDAEVSGSATGVAAGIKDDTTDFSLFHVQNCIVNPSPDKPGIVHRVVTDLVITGNTVNVSGTANNLRCLQTASSLNEVIGAVITGNHFINSSTGTSCQSIYGKYSKSTITENYLKAVNTTVDINSATYTLLTLNVMIGAGPTYVANGLGTGMVTTGNIQTTP